MIKGYLWKSTSQWADRHLWLLNAITEFFRTNYFLTPTFELFTVKISADEWFYAVMRLTGNFRSTKQPAAASMVVSIKDNEKSFALNFYDAIETFLFNTPVTIEQSDNPIDLVNQHLAGLFDSSAEGRAILQSYDRVVADEKKRVTEQKQLEEKAMEGVQRVMQRHMKQCWAQILTEIEGVVHINVLTEFKIREAMKAVVALEINSGDLNEIIAKAGVLVDPKRARHACLDDILRKCDRLGLYT
jgi:hypothetical protein